MIKRKTSRLLLSAYRGLKLAVAVFLFAYFVFGMLTLRRGGGSGPPVAPVLAAAGSAGDTVQASTFTAITPPEDAYFWIHRARDARQAGHEAEAREALKKAEKKAPRPDQLADLAGIYRELGSPKESLRLLEGLTRSTTEAALWIEQADAAREAGRRELALSSLKEAERRGPDPRARRRISLLYQEFKEYRRALRILEDLAAAQPADAGLLNDKGVCEFLSGGKDRAVADLGDAIKLAPQLVSAYLTLGSIHMEAGRYGEAARVYERGLAANPKADAAVKTDLEKSLKEARARAARGR